MLVFTANDQSFEGAIKVAEGVQKSRRELAVQRPPLAILPLPGRFDARDEVDTADKWLDRFSRELKPFYDEWLPKQFVPRRILELTKVPYVTKFSFGEPLAALERSLSDPEFPGFYLNNVARLIASDFSEAQQILTPAASTFDQTSTIAETTKKLLTSPADRIRLNDLVSDLIREAADKLNIEEFPVHSNEDFSARVHRYESAISKLATTAVLLARWASAEQIYLLDTIFERVAEFEKPGGPQSRTSASGGSPAASAARSAGPSANTLALQVAARARCKASASSRTSPTIHTVDGVEFSGAMKPSFISTGGRHEQRPPSVSW